LVTPASPGTWISVLLAVLVPLPSWPNQLLPLAHTMPSDFSTRTCEPPADA
jgi:hypothetical protein